MGKRKQSVPGKHDAVSRTTKKSKSSAAELSTQDVKEAFRSGLFDENVLREYHGQYTSSGPYPHAVIQSLVSDSLLLSVKSEILSNLAFTPKETDIYRIHQTGDLANLSGLPEHLANKLPSLRRLRDALYSQTFRDYVCGVTGCGALSGKKTDMAINVYTSGCHLLTHDDVIGSRRVSYILYLCGSPREPWDASWGGALRLYPTVLALDGVTKVPTAQWNKVIPPAWNQLSFFEVVPGESFHDVEEVYDASDGTERVRMAISGWFHIPQVGEDGYIEGLEEELAKKSSLQSLQSKNDQFDLPQPQTVKYKRQEVGDAGKGKGKVKAAEEEDAEDEDSFTPEEIEFLLKYIHPTYLTPDTLEQLSEAFAEDSSIQISMFLRPTFEVEIRRYIEIHDGEEETEWPVAVPPHKQKFLYLQPNSDASENPVRELIDILLPSKEFRKLLQHATGLKLTSHNVLARRFRRGMDYTLATALPEEDENSMQLEICLGLTPTTGWEPSELPPEPKKKRKKESPLNPSSRREVPKKFDDSTRSVGGYEMYMSTEDDDHEGLNDPAVYKASGEDGDDGVLFMNPPAWNGLSLVLRDGGVLKFVKYVSRNAKGDRWDVVGEFGVEEEDDDDVEEVEEVEEGGDEEEWKGCSP